MAGPGGGPPRRSHTKSRKGCDTCKKRHIRCDESFPQCRNCTKHKIRCPYNDIQVPEDRATSPDKPDLMWTPEIEAEIELWRQTGVFPFPSLNVFPAPSPQFMSVEDMRLIHHIASITHQLGTIDANGFTLWTRQVPLLLRIAATNDYVLQALLAFSAMHIAFLTDCPIVGNIAYVHRGAALKGLQEAISTFSKDTSDAILAASLVLSWQATDWRSWTQLMQGTSTVIEAMEPWKEESQFGEFMRESITFPTAPPSPTPDHKTSQPRKEDWDAYNRMLVQLQKLESYLKHNREDTKSIQQLVAFLKGARKVSPTLSIAHQFERLRPLRTWLFWIPVMYLQQTSGSFSSLMIIAHYYAVALLMERLFPEIGAAYFGSLSIAPTEEISRRLLSINVSGVQESDMPLALIRLPIETVDEFRSRMGWAQPARTPSYPHFDPPNFYVSSSGDSPNSIPATTVADGLPYSPYAESPTFSYSTEDLSAMVTPESGPNSAISPVQLASPFGHTQYLNIPSPSYGGYSPVSPNANDFGEGSSIVYSDTEELFSPFDMPFTASAPGLGAGSAFGVGFVPPMQTVWI